MQHSLQLAPQQNKENYFILDIEDIAYCNTLNKHFNLSLINNNLLINIADQLNIQKPIYIYADNDLVTSKFSELTIVSGKDSNFTLIEHKNNKHYTTNLICQEKSKMDYYLLQNGTQSKLKVTQHHNSLFDAKLLAYPLSSNRLEIIVNMLEPKAGAELNILQKTQQDFTNTINLSVNHLAEDCSSITAARAIAAENAKIELNGKVTVNKYAKKTYADLQIKNLILSKQASIMNRPELIIDNKDIICKHGSSTGNLDVDALFYMQNRGLKVEEATALLLDAFVKPIIQKVKYRWILDALDLLA